MPERKADSQKDNDCQHLSTMSARLENDMAAKSAEDCSFSLTAVQIFCPTCALTLRAMGKAGYGCCSLLHGCVERKFCQTLATTSCSQVAITRRTRYFFNLRCRARACAEVQQSQHKPKQKPEPLACRSGERLPSLIEAKMVLTGFLSSARRPKNIGMAYEGNAEFTPNVVPCQGRMMRTASTPTMPDHSLKRLATQRVCEHLRPNTQH